jgi:ATP-binding cassette, subfamily B, multidrug efflux pump
MNQIKRIFHFVKPYWKRAIVALVLLTSLVVLDLSIPRLVQRIIDQGINKHNQAVVLQTAAIMIGISIVSTCIAVGNNIFSVQVGESVARDIREAIFVKIQHFSYGNLDRHQTGMLMVRLTSDASSVQRLVQISLRIGTRAPFLFLGSLILMFVTSPSLALKLLPLLLVTSIVIIFFIIKMEPLFRSVQQRLDRLNTVLQENIAGARLVKAFVRAVFEGERFETANEAFTHDSVRVMRFMSSMGPALTVFVNIGMVLVIWAGGLQVIHGSLSIGQIVAFTNYLLTTMTPLTMMTQLSNTWANGLASSKRITQVLDTVPEVQDAADAIELASPVNGRVVFEGVTFHFNGAGEENVLEGVDLVAEPGQTIAILGATGAGKSTLVDLVPRFYDASSGRVLVDGIDVRKLKGDSLLANIALVPQESILFSGTVRDNIRYGCPEATEEQVIRAAKASQAHDFIMEMAQGYDSRVDARGANLSGGQKQRIAIARALLLKPRILILDDSTSSVDVETETRIQDALDLEDHHRTTFVVAQRISTVLNADKIIVIDRGRIAAEGTHKELLRSSPIYQEIYESQLGNGFHEVQPASPSGRSEVE